MEQILEFIKEHDRFAVFTHVNPDGDALGSAFSLVQALRQCGKTAQVILLGMPAQKYNFDEFQSLFVLFEKLDIAALDACISVDCADARRLSSAKDVFFTHDTLNIDHHVSNTKFAKVNYVEDAPSTGEIIYDVINGLGEQIDTVMQIALYMAISTDTGNFTYKNTTPKTLEICSELVNAGLDISTVADRVFNNRSIGATRLIAMFIDRMKLYYDDRLALSQIMLSDIEEVGARVEDTEVLINYARDIDSAEIAIFLREIKKDTYKVSLRTKSTADMSDFAGRYGGGGHVRAAGFMMKGNIYDILQEIIKMAGEYIL